MYPSFRATSLRLLLSLDGLWSVPRLRILSRTDLSGHQGVNQSLKVEDGQQELARHELLRLLLSKDLSGDPENLAIEPKLVHAH